MYLIPTALLFPFLTAVFLFRDFRGVLFGAVSSPLVVYAVKHYGLFGLFISLTVSFGIYLSKVDLERGSLSVRLPAAAFFLSFLNAFVAEKYFGGNNLCLFFFVVAFFVALREISWGLLGREGLGDADPSVAPLFFSFMGVEEFFVGIVAGGLFAVIHYLVVYYLRREKTPVPMIPYFLAGASVGALLSFSGVKVSLSLNGIF